MRRRWRRDWHDTWGENMEIRGTLVRSGYSSPIGRPFEFDEKCLCKTTLRS